MNFVQNQSKSQPVRIGFWSVLLFSIFAIAPATYPGYWQSLEGFLPVFNAISPRPIADIATTPDLWQGMGSGTFLFVQPFIALGLLPTTAVRIAFILSFLFGGLGIYGWLSIRLKDYVAGLAGILYMLFPPFLAVIYIRGSLSEAIVLGLFPLTLAGISLYSHHRSRSAAAVAIISLLWIWQTQAGLALFVTLLLLFYVLIVERNRETTLLILMGSIAGIASISPLWPYQVDGGVPFYDHFVYFFQLFKHDWTVAPSIPGWQDRYPFQIGFAALGFSICGLWLMIYNRSNKQSGDDSGNYQLFGFSFVCIAILILLSLQISEPIWRWSGADRLLRYPWQIIPLTGPFFAVTASSLPIFNRTLNSPPYKFTLIILVLLSSFPYLTTNFTQVEPPAAPLATIGPNHNFVILDAKLIESSTEPRDVTLELTWQVLHPLDFDYNIFFQAINPNGQRAEAIVQLDRQPFNGERPMTTWQSGEILMDTYRLDLSMLNQPNETVSRETDTIILEYHFGYYDWRDGKRLPIDGGLSDKITFYGQ